MGCLGSVPRGHTRDVRFIFECYFAKEGKTFGDNLRFVKAIRVFPDEYVLRQSIYRRKRFTSCWRRVLSQKRAVECAGRCIEVWWKAACSFWSFCSMSCMDQALAKEGPQGFSLGKKTSVSVFIFLLYWGAATINLLQRVFRVPFRVHCRLQNVRASTKFENVC